MSNRVFLRRAWRALALSLVLLAGLWLWPAPALADDPSLNLSWSSIESDNTYSVAWGDYDGDGDLDLAVGNYYGPNRLYRNDGGVLTESAIWSSADADITVSVAWGDYDGDGDLDLAGDNRLYRNDEGVLTTNAVWSATDADITKSVAWGDYDGDGDPDLAMGNQGPNRLYRNEGGVLTANAVWSSSEADNTFSVTWGDYDGDGDLDLVVVNYGLNRLYRNDGGVLTESAVWSSIEADWTHSVAWGDYDGDGDLDLATGSYWQPKRLYRNDAGVLTESAVWSSIESDDTQSVAWGDYDSDGDLDLAAGNYWEPNRLYRNDEGVLTESAVWSSTEADWTRSVAWGDYDGDGDLDLAVGNWGPNRLYRNDGGLLTASAIWSSTEADTTQSVVWGDYDGDGDFDLAAGNHWQPNLLYRNADRALTASAVWSSTETDETWKVAWGDYDGDGDLDLAAGNYAQPNRLHRNDGGGLTKSAVWSSAEADSTHSLAWGDYDGDGDLDLAAGNDGPNRLYRNEGGTLTASSVWSPIETDATFSVDWGDCDGDGDLDLAMGNQGPNRLYRNEGGVLTANAVWNSSEADDTKSVAWGDYDGDGDLDLAAGNHQQPNRLYRNDEGALTANAVWSSIESDYTQGVAWGDYDGDGDLDLAVANYWEPNRLYRNDEGVLTESAAWSSTEYDGTLSVGWGDYDDDGDLDLAFGNYEGPNRLYRNTRDNLFEPAPIPVVRIFRPGPLADADFYSSPYMWSGPIIPFTYTLTHPQALTVSRVIANYSLNGGGQWRPALAASGTQTTNLSTSPGGTRHVYYWDVFNSGLLGQSDNVVFRLQAIPAIVNRPNQVPGPYLYGSYAATTFPFRGRGSQVRVLDQAGQPVQGALVYRLPAGQTGGGALYADARGEPFRTDGQGYLQGRGQINPGDQLLALAPVDWTESMAWAAGLTETMRLYYTNARPAPAGLEAHTVTALGVQTLTVSAANPLLLFDLDVSLEWDASNDPAFLAKLGADLVKTSAALYDWTDGQVALGRVAVHQAKESWDEADLRIFATNQMRPIANRGGIVAAATSKLLAATQPITFSPGEVRMPPVWNRYGDPQPMGDDWPDVLAHELAHYALFLEDTYLGLDENDVLVPVDTCSGTAMTDPYLFSEFRYADGDWVQQCGRTLAEMPEWDIIRAFYPALGQYQPPPANSGPTAMPFVFTEIQINPAPDQSGALLDDPNIILEGGLSNGRAYLRHPNLGLVDLGRPVSNEVLARGAREGDELCVFAAEHFACSPLSNHHVPQLNPQPAWQPDVRLTPVDTTTLKILVNTPDSTSVTATIYPSGEAPQPVVLTPGETQTVALSQPAVEVLVDLAGDDPSTQRMVTGYAIGAGPGRMKGHGGPGRMKGHGGPFSSGDGSLIIYPPDNLPEDVFVALQTAIRLPQLPPGLTPIGRAYYVKPSADYDDFAGASLAFQYLGLEVLLAGGPEESLAVYRWDGATWERLETNLDMIQNYASAPVPGDGLYALAVGRLTPHIDAVWPTSGDSGLTHTLTISGNNFVKPLSVSLQGDSGSYALVPGSVSPQRVTVTTPSSLPPDLYDLELVNAGGLTATLPDAFALYNTRITDTCFFDDFESGLGKWDVSGEWDSVTVTSGEEAATDSPGSPYPSADPGTTLSTSITSHSFNLARCSDPVLHLRHDYELVAQDWITVEISIDAGATWLPLLSYTGQPVQALAAAPDDEWKQVNWQPVALNLAEAGIPTYTAAARLRFTLTADDFASARGWIVDQVSIEGAYQPPDHTVFLPLILK